MTPLDLMPLWMAILGFAVLMYILLDGFDLGVGMLFLFRRDAHERDLMVTSVSPVWDFNETWLVLGGAGMLGVLPGAYAVIMPALYIPVLFMLLGLLFRGVAFEFRDVPFARRYIWDRAFAWGSLVATSAQGVMLGAIIQGFPVANGQYVGTSWDWVRPFPLFTGVALVAGYVLQGATWLVMKTEHELQHWARRVARLAMIAVFACIAVVSAWTALGDARIAARWFSVPNIVFFAPVPVLSAIIAIVLWRATAAGRDALPFICSCALFFLSFSGLVISLWPYVGSESVTLWSGATAPASQEFLIIGTAFILPILVFYVAWSYWVFRGKVRSVHHYGGG